MFAEYISSRDDNSTVAYWRDYWSGRDVKAQVKALNDSALFRFVLAHLPPQGTILDAGCGLCPWIILLRQRSYHVIGVDIVSEPLLRAKQYDSELALEVADVQKLPFPAAAFDGCLSIGVVEHFESGPLSALLEARRVLKPNGVLIVAVPFLNTLKRFRLRRRQFLNTSKQVFHQYVFSREQLVRTLTEAGFIVETCWYFDQAHGLISGLGLLPAQLPHIRLGLISVATARSLRFILRRAVRVVPSVWVAHMILAVARVSDERLAQ